jgi:hypothetical protein
MAGTVHQRQRLPGQAGHGGEHAPAGLNTACSSFEHPTAHGLL